jgi:predicted RNA-binding Zn-ribbon protein involved in translation (DUF1610 family)
MHLHDSIHFQLESSRPHCPNCGTLMWLARIEPDEPDHDRRTYECPECDSSITEVVKYK